MLKRGTLKVGQPIVVGCEWGKVRSLRGPTGAVLKELLPGQAAEISGLRGLPDAGDPLLVTPRFSLLFLVHLLSSSFVALGATQDRL